ncbi:MAG: hypothetical protein H6704_26460 [Myxococcales bacterium]|nr:hypothetical protein [Myxococcales bacterium]
MGGEPGAGGMGGNPDADCETACDNSDPCYENDANCPGYSGDADKAALTAACIAACTGGDLDAGELESTLDCPGSVELIIGASADAAGICAGDGPDQSGGACLTDMGDPGVCVNTDNYDCEGEGGALVMGACPGGNNIVCCVELPCIATAGEGVCIDSGACDGETEAGLCPGNNSIMCCVE